MTTRAADFGKTAVLMGGNSAERDVSLNSGNAVMQGLLRRGVDAHGVDTREDVVGQLTRGGFDRVFIILRGRGGEDGVIQGTLETLGIPYTGSGVAGSALGMDKYRCKLMWKGLGLPTPPFVMIRDESGLAEAEVLGFPLMIKPVHEGSSIGMTRVGDAGELRSAWQEAMGYDSEVMAERWITGPEYTASILGEEALPTMTRSTWWTAPNITARRDSRKKRSSRCENWRCVHSGAWGLQAGGGWICCWTRPVTPGS